MPLAGYQGQRNTPAQVAAVLAELAQLRQDDPPQLAKQIADNVVRIFPRLLTGPSAE